MSSDQFRFLKKNRLKTPEQFRSVFNAGKRSIDSQFVVLASKNALGYSRIGLVISRRKINGAVQRNSLKRLIRESFRNNAITKKGYDIVILPQRTVKIERKELLRNSLDTHWQKITR